MEIQRALEFINGVDSPAVAAASRGLFRKIHDTVTALLHRYSKYDVTIATIFRLR